MEKENLIELIDSWGNLDVLVRELCARPELFSTLMEIALYSTGPKTWRAAYLADKIHDEYPELVWPYLGKMVERLPAEKNLSKKRHFLKLISMNDIREEHLGFLLDFCAETMASDEPVAIRVHAMQILYHISEKEPGLKSEILTLIEHELEYRATAGIRARGLRLVKKLRKQLQNHQES
ncbi:MAG: hypothetical protein JW761_00830 [Prolixibacteraceae bacterium]|nr:hypothetical protein [Prolixibacteraceae bacterium]